MQRKRNRKMTIDIMLEQTKFQRQHGFDQYEEKSLVRSQEVITSPYKKTLKQTQSHQVQLINKDKINLDFFEQMNYFQIKIKGISNRTNINNQSIDIQQINFETQNPAINKHSDQNITNPIDHGGTLQLVELMWTQSLKKQQIQSIINKQKYTLQTNDRNSSSKHAQIYQQLKNQTHHPQQKSQNYQFLSNPKEKLYQQSESIKFSQQQNNQCCQIM